ncbi:MAG: hypothetical protein IPI59_02615 [Sphingobacteriales bacterium]|jgi:hypothetical protein|nr:hypothetical protein [Sphingobacteriales bacterium]MBP9142561.1 hypothetical protein [Chitinophagales bacterium]MDA0199542.1 hypothetical protein [Bacteroidota bacterium]MBK7526457.1 hypothetical protein [Sphingobacteriales bacterium]MBK8679974.1 hypothetical protein [Sphingobacteriales bacterium]
MRSILNIAALMIIIGVLLFISACKDEFLNTNIDFGFEYFPLTSGFWAEYRVDSTIYSSFLPDGKANRTSYLREEVADTFTDNTGRLAYTIKRFSRTNDTLPWQNLTPVVWYAVRDSNQAERMEGELRFIKLIFPITENTTWNGNAYLDVENDNLTSYKNWKYTCKNINTPKTIGGNSFAQTTTILETDQENLIDKVYSLAVYAKNIGKVYREQWVLNTETIDATTTWPDRAKTGFIVKETILNYKK